MTLIFNGSFADNLRRINSSGTPHSERSKNPDSRFQQILADLEKTTKSPNNSKELSDAKTTLATQSGPETLTNMESKFLTPTGALGELHQLLKPIEASLASGTPDVKELTPSVKIAPPEPVLPQVTLPDKPVILSARRVAYAENDQTARAVATAPSTDVKQIITTAGRYHGVDPHLGLAVAQAESAFRTDAVSKDGHASKGVFQLLDSTAKDMLARLEVTDKYEPFDPNMNSFLGLGYLRRLHDLFSTETVLKGSLKTHPAKTAEDLEKLAVAAYNAGEGNVARAQAKAQKLGKDPSVFANVETHLPQSTQAYVTRVTKLRSEIGSLNSQTRIA